METNKINFTLDGEDLALLERLKKSLLKTHGKITSTAVIRMALRKLDSDARK